MDSLPRYGIVKVPVNSVESAEFTGTGKYPFSERRISEGVTLRPEDVRSWNVQDRRSTYRRRQNQSCIGIQAVNHEKSTLEAREVTKLHQHDSTTSNDEFPSYAQSINLISPTSTIHPVINETPDLYSEGATLSNFIYKGIPTITKPTFVALPSLTSHSTFYECLRSVLCKPQDSPNSPLTRLGVIISYSLHLERKITSSPTSIISPYVYSEPSDETIRRLDGVPIEENNIRD